EVAQRAYRRRCKMRLPGTKRDSRRARSALQHVSRSLALRQNSGGTSMIPSDCVDDFIKPYILEHQIPGCAIMVRHNGNVVTRGYGIANLEHDVKVTPKTVFQSASVGKQFTAMAVMLLVDEGKLS